MLIYQVIKQKSYAQSKPKESQMNKQKMDNMNKLFKAYNSRWLVDSEYAQGFPKELKPKRI